MLLHLLQHFQFGLVGEDLLRADDVEMNLIVFGGGKSRVRRRRNAAENMNLVPEGGKADKFMSLRRYGSSASGNVEITPREPFCPDS